MFDGSGLGSDTHIPEEDSSYMDSVDSKVTPVKKRKHKKGKRDRSSNVSNEKSFVLDGSKARFGIEEYNSLKDKHLLGHFYNKRLRKLLKNNGLITKDGHVVEGKTCVTDVELLKQVHPEREVLYKQAKKKTVILGVKLPRINRMPWCVNSESLKGRSTSLPETEKNKSDEPSPNITMTDTQEKTNTFTTQQPEESTKETSISGMKTPSIVSQSVVIKPKIEGSAVKSAKGRPRPHNGITLSPIKARNKLQPMSKEELKLAIERYKQKLNQTVVVDETPELTQMPSEVSSNRHERYNDPSGRSKNKSFDIKSKVITDIERSDTLELERKSVDRQQPLKIKGLSNKRIISMTPTPIPRTSQSKSNSAFKKNMNVKPWRPLEPIGNQERKGAVQNYLDLKLGLTETIKTVDMQTNSSFDEGAGSSMLFRENSLSPRIKGKGSIDDSLKMNGSRDEIQSTNERSHRGTSMRKVSTNSQSPTQKSFRDKSLRESVRKSQKKENEGEKALLRESTLQRKQTNSLSKELMVRQNTLESKMLDEKSDKLRSSREDMKKLEMRMTGSPYEVSLDSKRLQRDSSSKSKIKQFSQSPTQRVEQSTKAQEINVRSSFKKSSHDLTGVRTSTEKKLLLNMNSLSKRVPTQENQKSSNRDRKKTIENSNTEPKEQADENSIDSINGILFALALATIKPSDQGLVNKIQEKRLLLRSQTPPPALKTQETKGDNKQRNKVLVPNRRIVK